MAHPVNYIEQLAEYIKKNLVKGYTLESLKWSLVSQGYSRSSVERAIELTNEQLAKQAPLMKEKPVIKVEIEPKIEIKITFWEKIKKLFR